MVLVGGQKKRRQLKETSGFESYLADLFVFNRAVSIFVRTL